MRVAIFLLGIMLFFSASAGAQGPAGVGAGSGNSSVGPDYDPWQIFIGYQFNRDNLFGSPFNTNGVNISVARYFKQWIGLEAQLGTGFVSDTGQGTTPPNLDAKSIFVGGGPQFVYRHNSRYEPWAHVMVGMEHFRFTQSGTLGSNTSFAFEGGGGVDVYLNSRLAIRGEVDELGTRFLSATQRSFQAVVGVVFNF